MPVRLSGALPRASTCAARRRSSSWVSTSSSEGRWSPSSRGGTGGKGSREPVPQGRPRSSTPTNKSGPPPSHQADLLHDGSAGEQALARRCGRPRCGHPGRVMPLAASAPSIEWWGNCELVSPPSQGSWADVNKLCRSRSLREASQHRAPIMHQDEPAAAPAGPPSGRSGQRFPAGDARKGPAKSREPFALSSPSDLMGAHADERV
jgi:hypothetical protein